MDVGIHGPLGKDEEEDRSASIHLARFCLFAILIYPPCKVKLTGERDSGSCAHRSWLHLRLMDIFHEEAQITFTVTRMQKLCKFWSFIMMKCQVMVSKESRRRGTKRQPNLQRPQCQCPFATRKCVSDEDGDNSFSEVEPINAAHSMPMLRRIQNSKKVHRNRAGQLCSLTTCLTTSTRQPDDVE
jgi:hypothetical protein